MYFFAAFHKITCTPWNPQQRTFRSFDTCSRLTACSEMSQIEKSAVLQYVKRTLLEKVLPALTIISLNLCLLQQPLFKSWKSQNRVKGYNEGWLSLVLRKKSTLSTGDLHLVLHPTSKTILFPDKVMSGSKWDFLGFFVSKLVVIVNASIYIDYQRVVHLHLKQKRFCRLGAFKKPRNRAAHIWNKCNSDWKLILCN